MEVPKTLFNQEAFADLRLDLKDKTNNSTVTIHLHKFILQMRCPELLKELMNSEYDLIDGITVPTFFVFMEYLYYDYIKMPEGKVTACHFCFGRSCSYYCLTR